MEESQGDYKLRDVTRIRIEAEQKLAALNVSALEPIMADKAQPGTLATNNLVVSTNIYGLTLGADKPVYQYNLSMVGVLPPRDGRTKLVEFTGQVRGDPNCVNRRDDCRKIYLRLLQEFKSAFPDVKAMYFYDLKALLFTLALLDVEQKKEYVLETGPNFYENMEKVVVTVMKVADKSQFTIGASTLALYIHADLSKTDRTLTQFLEIALAQPVLFDPKNHVVFNAGTSYFFDPTIYGFSARDTPPLQEGKYLALGASKSVRFVEGPKGRNTLNTAVVVETKKTPFHMQQKLMDKVNSIVRLGPAGRIDRYDLEKLRKAIKGLFVQTTHRDSNRILQIKDVYSDTPRSSVIDDNEKFGKVNIEEYFLNRYNLPLHYPESPLVGIRMPQGAGSYAIMKFPMEVLFVVDNQRVTTEQQSKEQISLQIRACAVLPSVLKEQISKCADAVGLFNNEHLEAASIKVVPKPLNASARRLPHPAMVYKGQTTLQTDDRGTWRDPRMAPAQFLIPATCAKWATFLIDENARDAITYGQMTDFLQKLVAEAQKRGMNIGEPAKIGKIEPTENALKEMMEKCVGNGVEFVFFIHAGRDVHLHGLMKYFELKGIITQDCKSQTASDVVVKNKFLTLENIVMKTNLKLGGLNYAITITNPELGRMLDKDILYIGFGANHPGGGLGGERDSEGAPPTVVGFAANDNPHPFEFTGDFVFQETRRDEKVDVMKDIITNILDRFHANRKIMPKYVIIYRNGCSEGQFGDVISYEIPLIQAALKEQKCDAKLMVIVPNKLHNLRFIPSNLNPQDKAPEQNVKPGTIIDTQVVHPAWNEFYLCSHTTLQGTAKVPRYTVLYDDTGISVDQIQQATYALAYGHQIVRSPTSLPAPAYIAGRYAERGRTMLKAHSTSETVSVGSGMDNENLNNTITLRTVDGLRGKRINA